MQVLLQLEFMTGLLYHEMRLRAIGNDAGCFAIVLGFERNLWYDGCRE